MYLQIHRRVTAFFILLLATQFCSCAGTHRSTADQPPDSSISQPFEEHTPDQTRPRPEQDHATSETPEPRAIASLELTTQGKNLLAQGQPDGAIRLLERAIQLSPTNGQNYYYLAEAWLMKKNVVQALEFNDLARIYFTDDKIWLDRAEKQRERIDEGKE